MTHERTPAVRMLSRLTLLVAVIASISSPALSYVRGNYVYHFWRGMEKCLDGDERRGWSEITHGLRQLRECRRSIERDTRKARERAGSAEEKGETEKARACRLLVEFHEELRLPESDAEKARQRALFDLLIDDDDPISDAFVDDLRLLHELGNHIRPLEVDAIFAEQMDRRFARGHQLRGQAVAAYEEALETLGARVSAIEDAARRGETRRLEYLRQRVAEIEQLTDFLRREHKLCSDPVGMAGRYVFYAMIAEAHSSSRARIWATHRDTYLGKARYAIKLARESDSVAADKLDDLEGRLASDRLAPIPPAMPDWCYLVEMELPFFHHYGIGLEYGGTTEIANELLKQNKEHARAEEDEET